MADLADLMFIDLYESIRVFVIRELENELVARNHVFMKYLCLIYHDEDSPVPNMSAEEFEEIAVEVRDCIGAMRDQGSHIVAAPLKSGAKATSFRMSSGGAVITDGPFIETKEQLAGFYLIEARDLNDAIRIMSKTPSSRFGTIEVRLVEESLYMAPTQNEF